MELKEYIQLQVTRGRNLLDSALADTPQDIMNQKGGEHLNTIAAVYSHVIGGEDYFVNVVLHGNESRIWESQGWATKLGLSAEIGQNWGFTIPDLAAFQPYVAAVHAATDAYVATVTPAELDRLVTIFNNKRPVANVLTILAIHTAGHAGEIATIKAALNMKGLPF